MNSKKMFSVLSVVFVIAMFSLMVNAWHVNNDVVSGISLVNISQSGTSNLMVSWGYRANLSGNAYFNISNRSAISRDSLNLSALNISFINMSDGKSYNLSKWLPNYTSNAFTNNSFGFLFHTVVLSDGVYNLSFYGHNATDNVTITNTSVFKDVTSLLIVDNTAPVVSFVSPANGSVIRYHEAVVFNVSVTNDSRVTAVQNVNISNYTAFNAAGTARSNTIDDRDSNNNDGGYFNITFNQTGLTEGLNFIAANVNDTAGNRNNSVYVKVYVDTIAAEVYLQTDQALRNWTWTDDDTPIFTFNYTDNTSPNASCELFIDGTTGYGTNTSAKNHTITNITANHSLLEGLHFWYVNCTDFSGIVNSSLNSSGPFWFEHRLVKVVSPTNGSFTSEMRQGNLSFAFNFTSFNATSRGGDRASNVSCELWITNGTAGDWINYGVNTTSMNSTLINITNNYTLGKFNVSGGNFDGLAMNWTINCTWNGTQITAVNDNYYTFYLDNLTPTVSLSKDNTLTTSTTLVVDITASSDTQTCTTSRPGASVTGTGASQVITEGNLLAGTSYAYDVTCSDAALNRVTTSGSFTTDADTGSSGTGGASGGSSSGSTGQFAQTTWASIAAGETASIPVENGAIGITEVSFEAAKNTYGAWIKISKIESLPSTVSAYSGAVYKNIKIAEANVQKSMIDVATIDFKVLKTWLAENNLGPNDVAMSRYVDNTWIELKTTLGSDDGTYVHYTAETPGFSYFVIGQKVGAVSTSTTGTQETTAPSTDMPVVTETAGEEMPVAVAEEGGMSLLWLVPVVLVLIAIAVLVWIKRR